MKILKWQIKSLLRNRELHNKTKIIKSGSDFSTTKSSKCN